MSLIRLPKDSALEKALKQSGQDNLVVVLSMLHDDIENLTYKDGKNPAQEVPQHMRNWIYILQQYQQYRTARNEVLSINDWINVTVDEIDDYRISPHFHAFSSVPAANRTRATNVSALTGTTVSSAVANFRKGIKRDPTHFPKLKHAKYWDSYRRSVVSIANAQGVEDVLDSTFAPTDADAIALFVEQKKYMYDVFHQSLETDQGKAIVREHEDDFDAQKVWQKVFTHYTTSTKATLSAGNILGYITTAQWGNRDWKGTAEGFVLHWLDQVRLYDSIAKHPLDDTVKDQMLKNAVRPLSALRQVTNTAQQLAVQNNTPPSYEVYKQLLLAAAAEYDSQFQQKRPAPGRSLPGSSSRTVYTHDQLPPSSSTPASSALYTIDTHVQDLDAFYDVPPPPDPPPPTNINAHSTLDPDSRDLLAAFEAFRSRRVSMGRDKWTALDDSSKQLWDKLTDSAKAIILGAKPPAPTGQEPQRRSFAPSLQRRASLHDISAHDYLSFLHEQSLLESEDTNGEAIEPDDDDATLLTYLTKQKKPHPADVRRMLSSSMAKSQGSKPNSKVAFQLDGKKFQEINFHSTVYDVSRHSTKPKTLGSLVDCGANGGVGGSDVRVIDFTHRTVDIRGIDDHEIRDIRIATVGGVVPSQHGDVIAIMHQYAYTGQGKSIHSPGQLESYGLKVNEQSLRTGGLQRIKTADNYYHPLNIRGGLPYITMRPYTDKEWDELPHVVWTSAQTWDPSVLDFDLEHQENWFDSVDAVENDPNEQLFDQFGNYRKRYKAGHSADEHHMDPHLYYFDAVGTPEQLPLMCSVNASDLQDPATVDSSTTANREPRASTTCEPEYDKYRKHFGWLSTEVIKKTFSLTTQYGTIPKSEILQKRYKSPNPVLNIPRRDEPVATDTVYADEPAIDNGATSAQFFVGTESMVTDVYGMKTDKQFVNTLEDNIIRRGAPTKLISDKAQVESSNKVYDILRALFIAAWYSEPHQQHQNPAERRWQDVKRMTNTVLDRTGAPAYTWLLCLLYVCFILNHTYCKSIDGIPLQRLTGVTTDISPLLFLWWWAPVYYKIDETAFPSESREGRGRFVGLSENVGHAMTYKILTDDTRKVIFRSQIRLASDSVPNLRLDPLGGEDSSPPPTILKSIRDPPDGESINVADGDGESKQNQMPVFNPADLVGRSFLMDPQEDGQRFRATIVEKLEDHDSKVANNPTRIKFLCKVNDEEEFITYSEVLDYIERDEESDIVWKFKRIVGHQGPLKPNHPHYMGSTYNVMVEWENGEVTEQPLNIIAADDPVTCAIYARDNGLLNKEGWKRFKRIAGREGKYIRMVKQAKLRSFRHSPKFKYGFEVPRNYEHALELDKAAGNTKWQDAVALEMAQLDEYNTFKDVGYGDRKPPGYKKIRVHLVFDVKHDGRHKARCVAGGHLTDVPTESVYSGVVSLRGLRLLVFLAELNKLETWATDIGNAYLEAKTSEKVYIVAGPEFAGRNGHTLIIYKSLYGLRSSGARWHERFYLVLKEMGFEPCRAEPDIWMRPKDGIYEYIAVYVDDLAIASRNPTEIVQMLEKKYNFKLKGTGPITFHLGCDFFRDPDGTLCFAPRKYIDKMIGQYKQLFGEAPKQNVTSPLEKGDHPELDDSELLDEKDIRIYQSMIGSLQWAITIGRLDITTAVMSLSSFRAAPRAGHLARARRVYGYLAKMKHAVIRIRTDEPDYSDLPTQDFDWDFSVYGKVTEMKPDDAPEPLGLSVVLTHYVDANLYHDMITGRSVTGILHFINQTPIDWYSKKQATVETATYGSEFVAARTCVEQILDLRHTLRYLGVPIRDKSFMFGDNKSVVDSGTIPHAKLHKRHTALSFHRVREAIAAGIIGFYFLPGELNPADILSKHWAYQAIWPQLQAILFWQGDTSALLPN